MRIRDLQASEVVGVISQDQGDVYELTARTLQAEGFGDLVGKDGAYGVELPVSRALFDSIVWGVRPVAEHGRLLCPR